MGDLDKSSVSLPPWASAARDEIAAAWGVPTAVASRVLLCTHPLIARHSPGGVLGSTPGAPREHPRSTPAHRGAPGHPGSTPATGASTGMGAREHPGSTPGAPRLARSSEEERERDPTLRSGGVPGSTPDVDCIALTAELTETVNRIAKTTLRPGHAASQNAVVSRIHGHGLAPGDEPAESVGQVRAVVEHCAAAWSPAMLSISSILGVSSKYWDHVGRVGAGVTPAGAGPQPPPAPTPLHGYFERDGQMWYRDGNGNERQDDGPVSEEQQAELARAARAAANLGGGA